jgi:hypothetical protein
VVWGMPELAVGRAGSPNSATGEPSPHATAWRNTYCFLVARYLFVQECGPGQCGVLRDKGVLAPRTSDSVVDCLGKPGDKRSLRVSILFCKLC